MTDTLTRPAADKLPQELEPSARTKKRVVLFGLIIGVLVGLGVFAFLGGPSRAELKQSHWEQVVDYYSEQYQVMTDARAAAEAAHWEEVASHYARQYELMRNAQSAPATDREAAHWEAVVAYYEQQSEVRTK